MSDAAADIANRGPAEGTDSALLRVYNGVRHGVITGDIPGGTRLNEQRFAERFSVSRVPLREAFARLAGDGFLRQQARRSAVVTSWTPDRVEALFDTRLALEVEAARYATRRVAGGGTTEPLRALLRTAEHDIEAGDAFSIAERSTSFHVGIVELTGNPLLLRLMQTISHEVTWLFYLTSQRDAEAAGREHHLLLDAIEAGNEELARAIAFTHIEEGRNPSLRFFEGER